VLPLAARARESARPVDRAQRGNRRPLEGRRLAVRSVMTYEARQHSRLQSRRMCRHTPGGANRRVPDLGAVNSASCRRGGIDKSRLRRVRHTFGRELRRSPVHPSPEACRGPATRLRVKQRPEGNSAAPRRGEDHRRACGISISIANSKFERQAGRSIRSVYPAAPL